MTRSIALKVAVSALAAGVTIASWPAAQARQTVSTEKQAGDAANQARLEAAKGNLGGATGFAEQAVAASPRDVGYRMLLADLYLKGGRFQSAASTYADIISLDPSNQRAALTLALCDVAQGRNDAAVAMLDSVRQSAPTADVGLAYAIAGQPQRAIAMLEPAAHAMGATGRLRQNLAFAYAMAGDWQKARATASQDTSPADLAARLAQWADLAKPSSAPTRVAVLLGVHPVADAGQPERLALAPTPAPTALAAADPAPITVAPAEPQPAAAEPVAPVAVASADVAPWIPTVRPAEDSKPKAQEVTRQLYAEAVRPLVTAQPTVLSTPRAVHPRLASFELPRSAPIHGAGDTGHFAVQLGAFSSSDAVERAWVQVLKRFAFADLTPLSTTISLPGKGTLHRLSVAGFESRAEADRSCRSIRAKGGVCFVRAVAGDVPTRWASRYAGRKTALASR